MITRDSMEKIRGLICAKIIEDVGLDALAENMQQAHSATCNNDGTMQYWRCYRIQGEGMNISFEEEITFEEFETERGDVVDRNVAVDPDPSADISGIMSRTMDEMKDMFKEDAQ